MVVVAVGAAKLLGVPVEIVGGLRYLEALVDGTAWELAAGWFGKACGAGSFDPPLSQPIPGILQLLILHPLLVMRTKTAAKLNIDDQRETVRPMIFCPCFGSQSKQAC